MKKVRTLVAVAVVALLAVSCKPSIDSLIDDYEDAIEKQDLKKVEKIEKQFEERQSEFTEAQKQHLSEVVWSSAMDAFEDYADDIEDDFDNLNDNLEDLTEDIENTFDD